MEEEGLSSEVLQSLAQQWFAYNFNFLIYINLEEKKNQFIQ